MSRLSDPRPESAELLTEGPTPSRVWGDQWLRVYEKVVKGLNQQFANRVASLEDLVAALDDDTTIEDRQLVRSLTKEVSRLSQLLNLYRLMPAEPFVTMEPVRIHEVVQQIMELQGHHVDLRGIPIDVAGHADAASVVVRPSALLRCLLVLAGSAAGNALRSRSAPRMSLEYGSDADHVWVRMQAPCPSDQLLFSGDGSLVHAVQSGLAHAHGHCHAEIIRGKPCDQIRYILTLPIEAEYRRIEQAGLQ